MLVATATAAVAVLLSALLTALLARRVRAGAKEVGSPELVPLDVVSVTWGPTSGSPARATDEEPPANGREACEVRALRAQVRVLEMALSETLAEGTDARSTGLVHRRRVDATVRGLARVTTSDEPQEQRVLRTLAAIERLDAPAGFARPVLSPVAPALLTETGCASPAGPGTDTVLGASDPDAVVEAPAQTHAAPASEAPPSEAPRMVPAQPVTVLPIPPLEMPDQGRRGRSRRRARARAS